MIHEQKIFRPLISVVVAFSLLFSLSTAFADNNDIPHRLQKWDTPIHYIALGDSLAAGVTPNNELGQGYPDLLAKRLEAVGMLQSYNKGFSEPGYTTTNVLDDLKNNVTRDVYGKGVATTTATIQSSLKEAAIITISAGANDVLANATVNVATNQVKVDLGGLIQTFQAITSNYKEIIQLLEQLNPDAQIYVMGYYNPFPYLSEEQRPQIESLLKQLNEKIQEGIAGTKAVFVPTSHLLETDYESYLPNPNNIHLSEAGYEQVAQLFWQAMQTEEPATPEVVWTDITGHWAEEAIHTAVLNKLANGFPDQTFRPNDSITRAEFTVMLSAAMKWAPVDTKTEFTDQAAIKDWAAGAIAKAVHAGVIGGYEDGSFRPNAKITRLEIVSMIAKSLGETNTSVEKTSFADDDQIVGWAKGAAETVHQLGIVQGRDGNKLVPHAPTTRAEAVVILLRLLSQL